MAATITSASATFILRIPGVFPGGVRLQQFAVDEAFDSEVVDAAETQVGVDGDGVAGWIPREVPMTITLLGSSISFSVFDAWAAAQDAARDVIYAQAHIRVPALATQYACRKGVLKRYAPLSNIKKVIAARQFGINWLPNRGIPAIIVSPV